MLSGMLQASKQLKRDWKLARLCVGERNCAPVLDASPQSTALGSQHPAELWANVSLPIAKLSFYSCVLAVPPLASSTRGKNAYVYICIHIYICIYTYICMYTCMYVCVCVFLYLRMPKADPREGNAEPWGIVRPKVSQRTTNTVRLSWFLFPHC